MANPTHVPVMLPEVLSYLPLSPGGTAVDGTIGLAGHARELAARIAPGGLLVGLDWDESMLARARENLAETAGVHVALFHTDYRNLAPSLAEAAAAIGRPALADGILLDLGLNNAQIEDATRGISFRNEGPLDMRMDRTRGEPASAALNRMTASQIETILYDYGDERWARRIAQVIVDRRKREPLKTTADLVDCVLAAIPAARRDKRIHPATRTFQAVRVYINREIDGLEDAVRDAAFCLAPGGVLVTLSYHSGEDRAVKHVFRDLRQTGPFAELTPKPQTPSEQEIATNPKSRSAKLRALKRLPEPPGTIS